MIRLPLSPLLAIALLAAAPPLPADEIVLTTGRSVQGRIIQQTEQYVTLEANGFTTRLRRDSIKEIRQDDPWKNQILAAEDAFRRGAAVRGVDFLFAAARDGAPQEQLSEALRTSNAAISSAIADAHPQDRAAMRVAMRRLLGTSFLSTKNFYHASQYLYQLEDYDAAVEALDRIPAEEIREDALMRAYALELLRFFVKRQLARGDFEGSLTYVERIRRLAGNLDTPELPLALLAQQADARDKHQYREAIRIIADDLFPLVPEIARNRATYALGALQAWADTEEEYNEGLAAIEPLAPLFPLEYNATRDFLVLEMAKLKMRAGAVNDVVNIVETVPPDQRGRELTELYKKAYHEAQLQRFAKDEDPLEMLRHGRWAMDAGLVDEAIALFNRTRENPNLEEVSDQLITTLRQERDTRLMERAHELYELGQMHEVVHITAQLLRNPDRGTRLRKEAEQLENLANEAMVREEEVRGYQAEVLYQQAERAYFMSNLEESFNLIQLVLNRYPDSAAARRGAGLLPDVVRGMEMAYLEGKTTRLPNIAEDVDFAEVQRTDQLGEEVTTLMDAMQTGI